MIGLALGVLAMIVVLSVMNGFQREMSSRILGMVPHATIRGVQPVAGWPALADKELARAQVVAAAPCAEPERTLAHRGVMQPIQIHGIDPAHEARVSILPEHIRQGRLDDLQAGEYGVVVGDITARRFGLQLGDKLTLIIPELSSAPGGVTPRMQRLNVV